jgi:hypothetical protein
VDGRFKRMSVADAEELNDFALSGETIPPFSKAEKRPVCLTGQTGRFCLFGVISSD